MGWGVLPRRASSFCLERQGVAAVAIGQGLPLRSCRLKAPLDIEQGATVRLTQAGKLERSHSSIPQASLRLQTVSLAGKIFDLLHQETTA